MKALSLKMIKKVLKNRIILFNGFVMIALIFILAIIHVKSIDAQQNIEFYSLDINFWPEYDGQNMLVRYKGILDPNTELPVKLRFKLPYNSTLMNYVTVENLSGQKIYLPYEVYQEGLNQVVEFTIDTLQFELTYHDENFSKIAESRYYNNDLVFEYFIYDLNIIFQQPESAQDIQIKPTPQEQFIGMYNLNYHVVNFENIEPENVFSIQINYFKDNDDLTFNYVKPVLPNQPSKTESNFIVYIVIAILTLIIITLIIYLLRVENSENINIHRNLKNSKKEDSQSNN